MASRTLFTLHGKQVTPDVLPHTRAMIMLQATQDNRKVPLWLRQDNLTTTEVYGCSRRANRKVCRRLKAREQFCLLALEFLV